MQFKKENVYSMSFYVYLESHESRMRQNANSTMTSPAATVLGILQAGSIELLGIMDKKIPKSKARLCLASDQSCKDCLEDQRIPSHHPQYAMRKRVVKQFSL